MTPITLIAEGVSTLEATVAGDRVLIDPELLEPALGWTLQPEGLCRQDVCVPLRDKASLFDDGKLDLEGVARALGRATVIDSDTGVVAMALPSEGRLGALRELKAPSFTLPDLEGKAHSLQEWRGKKKLLVAFASW